MKLSTHFDSKEFQCPCCKATKIDNNIIDLLEKLFSYMNAYKIVITSGYRCNKYEMSLPGGVKNGYHTKAMAVDINVWKNASERYTAKEIALALEDLNWNHGIGLITKTAVHIDSRTNKYWFDESKGCKSIGNSFYDFYGIKSESKIKDNNILESIKKVCSKFNLNNTFWENNYNTDLGKECIKDLFIKISKLI